MTAAPQLRKLPFQVLFASSHADNHPPQSLQPPISPDVAATTGWLSQPFCAYPQQLILRLTDGKCRVRKLQLLAHHACISTRIDLGAGNRIPFTTVAANSDQQQHTHAYGNRVETLRAPQQHHKASSQLLQSIQDLSFLDQIEFNRLGFVSLDDNTRADFRARELKSIHLDVYAEYIQLILDKCHVNAYNLFNQVGLVAINVLGDTIAAPATDEKRLAPQLLKHVAPTVTGLAQIAQSEDSVTPVRDPAPASTDDHHEMATELYADNAAAKWIHQLHQLKDKAIADEDFVLAKRVNVWLQEVFKAGKEIGRLDLAKHDAIDAEQFDEAIEIKTQEDAAKKQLVAKMRAEGFAVDGLQGELVYRKAAAKGQLGRLGMEGAAASSASSLPGIKSNAAGTSASTLPPAAAAAMTAKAPVPPRKPPQNVDDVPIKPKALAQAIDAFDENSVPPGLEPSRGQQGNPLPPVAPIKKVVVKKQPDVAVEQQVEEVKAPVSKKPVKLTKNLAKSTKQSAPPDSNNKHAPFSYHPAPAFDLDGVDDPDRAAADHPDIADVLGGHFTAALLSKQFNKREWALEFLIAELKEAASIPVNNKATPISRIVHACYTALERVFSDSREKISIQALQVWANLIEFTSAKKYTEPQFSRILSILVPLLFARAAETNPRIKSGALDLVALLYAHHGEMFRPLLLAPVNKKEGNSSTPAKVIRARVDCVSHVLSKVENVAPPPVDVTMRFILPLLDNPNGEVREHAALCCMQLYKRHHSNHAGNARQSILSLLGPTIRPQILAAIKHNMDVIDAGAWTGVPDTNVKHSPERTVTNRATEEPLANSVSSPERSFNNQIPSKIPTPVGHAVPTRPSHAPAVTSPTPAAKAPKPTAASIGNEWNIDKTCIFCEEQNPLFTDENLDTHYWQDCPMLTKCANCGHIVEVSGLTQHYLNDCDCKEDRKLCLSCRVAVPSKEYDSHRSSGQCQAVVLGQSRCPLCGDVVPDGDKGWRQHLTTTRCARSPRSKKVPAPAPTSPPPKPAVSSKLTMAASVPVTDDSAAPNRGTSPPEALRKPPTAMAATSSSPGKHSNGVKIPSKLRDTDAAAETPKKRFSFFPFGHK